MGSSRHLQPEPFFILSPVLARPLLSVDEALQTPEIQIMITKDRKFYLSIWLASLITTALLTLMGCGYRLEEPAPEATPHGPPSAEAAQRRPWPTESVTAADQSVPLPRTQMTREEQDYWRTQYQQTDLVALPVPGAYRTNVFLIRNNPQMRETALIGPRIFAYRSSDGARLAHRRNPDGTVTLSFPLVLADGLAAEITAPSGVGTIRLPSDLLVQDPEGLQAYVSRAEGRAMQLAPLPGCPTRIIVRVANQEYDLTPQDATSGDLCRLNRPFSDSLTLCEGDARYLLENALYAGAVDVRATYQTRVPFTVSQLSLEFDRTRLRDALENAIQAEGGYWFRHELGSKIQRVVRQQAIKVGIQGEQGDALNRVVDLAIQAFFEPMPAEAQTQVIECRMAAQSCMQLKIVPNGATAERAFTVSWQHSSTALTTQNYLTWSKLQPLQDRSIVIGESAVEGRCNETGEGGRPQCRRSLGNDGRSIETGLTVLAGDLLEITPSFIEMEQRELSHEARSHASNPVCIRRRTETLMDCDSGGSERHYHCKPYTVDRGCAETQDQYVDTKTYERRDPLMIRIDQPVGQLQQIFGGLFLKFVYRKESGTDESATSTEVTKECPLNAFPQEGDGLSLRLRLEPRASCRVFDDVPPGYAVMLHLVNRIQQPVSYTAGTITDYWDGRHVDATHTEQYTPAVLFGGTVSIRGYSIGSASADGAKL